MTFSEMLEAVKKDPSLCFTRKGWNGEGMYIWLVEAVEIPRSWIKEPGLWRAIGDRETIKAKAHFRILDAEGEVVSGWKPTNNDMFADDWQIVD